MSNDIDLSNYEIYDIYGVGRKKLTGVFSQESLIELFCTEWVQLVECHQCGRGDYCKYTQPHEYNPDKKLDIPCGVVVNSIKSYVHSTFPVLEKKNFTKIQSYLDGSFYFAKFIMESEMTTGMYIDDIASSFGEYAPAMVGHMIKMRDTLNMLAREFSAIPEFSVHRGVLFVEGQSEEAFLNKLKDSHLSWFVHLIIENYKGEGNSKAKRIQMLLEDYHRKGYKVYIQGDADGKEQQKLDSFLKIVAPIDMFIFRHDFETAIPSELLLVALQKLDCLSDVTVDEFHLRVTAENKSVVKIIKEAYDFDITSLKVDLAIMVARILNESVGWWSNEDFMKTELGQFLRFVQKI